MSDEIRAEVVELDSLIPDPGNVRDHPARNRKLIRDSMERFGAARSGVVDRDGRIVAGSGTYAAAVEAGITQAVIVETDGQAVVFVRRPDWSQAEGDAYAIADNRSSDLSRFDYRRLAERSEELRAEGIDLLDLGFESYELEVVEGADWSPPSTDPGSLQVETSGVAAPVQPTLDQRGAFDRAARRYRAEVDASASDGQVLEALALAYLGESDDD